MMWHPEERLLLVLVNYLSQKYWSPMHAAAARGNVKILKILLAAKGKRRLKGPRKGARTPLDVAKKPEIKALLR